MLSIVLIAAACGPQNTCTCKACLDPTDTTQCCPTDDNRGGGCFGDSTTMPVPLAKDVMPYHEIPVPVTEEEYYDEIIPDDELPQE